MQVTPQEKLPTAAPPQDYAVAVAGAYVEMVVTWQSGQPSEYQLAVWNPDLSRYCLIPETQITVKSGVDDCKRVVWANFDPAAVYICVRVQGDAHASASINSRASLAVCGSGENGPITTFGPGLWIPDAPPAVPAADDDEFLLSTLDPRWNLHTTGRSGNPMIWQSDVIDEATVETGHIVRYQIGAPGNPSAFVVQPPANNTDEAGMARKLTAGVSPTNWIMKGGFSYSVNRETPASPNLSLTMFMANDAPGNGFGDWDYLNQVCIYIQADYSGVIITGLKTIAGVSSQLATGTHLITDEIPSQWCIKKTGDLYRVSVRFANNEKIIIQSEDLTGQGLVPVRFGFTFQARETMNPIVPVAYVRHQFAARGF